MEKITIGLLAKKSGVGIETVRFYQRKNLIREPNKSGSIRLYSQEDIERIIFIKRAQELGFSLAEIKDLLEINTKNRQTCTMVKKKTMEKISQVEAKINDLLKMKEGLTALACACDEGQDLVKQFKVQECFAKGNSCAC
jgi:MerR family transcriptional regulator, mercuric resistance operon regulatory protein